MTELIRIVLIDPSRESRETLRRTLGTFGTYWLAEVLDNYQDAASRVGVLGPDLVIVALDHNPNQALDVVAALTNAHPRIAVLAASSSTDSALILRAIRAGAREFLTLPAEASELLSITGRLFRGREESLSSKSREHRVISVAGASGGVGVTSIAVNLATCLAARPEEEAILLDFDMLFGSVDAALDIIAENRLDTVLQNFERLDATLLKRSMTRHASGLFVLPHPRSFEEVASIDPETLRRLLILLRAAFANVVIDTSKGLQSSDFTALEVSDFILLVAQLEVTSLRNTSRLIGLLKQIECPPEKIKLVINRVDSRENEISFEKAEEALGMPISWQIPNATKIFQSARIKGAPIADVGRGSRPHQVFLDMARALRPAAEKPSQAKRGLFAALF